MKILVLSTWFPYPLDQGSRIRAYYLIRALATKHELALISFEDQPLQPAWLEHMRSYFTWIKTLPEKPFQYTSWRTLLGFFSARPSAVVAGFNRRMKNLVAQSAQEWQPDAVFAFTFVTAPYALQLRDVIRIIDIDNLLALMLQEEIRFAKNWLSKMRKTLAYWKFRRYEDRIYSPFTCCLVTSELDVKRLQQYTRITPEQIICVPNGVDHKAYNLKTEKKPGQLIYNGALTYQPNFDAMQYFLSEIFLLVLQEMPETHLVITGSTTGVDKSTLALNSNVEFSGYVNDIRPLIAESQLCVVPLRQGAGTRLKILEAMSLGTAVISTSKGAEGLVISDRSDIWIADSATAFAQAILVLLRDPEKQSQLSSNARQLIQTRYSWDIISKQFTRDLEMMGTNQPTGSL